VPACQWENPGTAGSPRSADAGARDRLFVLVYEELRELADRFLAAEKRGATLQPTALVHEAYLRLEGIRDMRLQQ